MHENPKHIPIPDPGDDILTSLEAAFNAAGIIIPFDSTSAFLTALASAETAGIAPTTAHPWYGAIGRVIYQADGLRKDGTGPHILTALNAPQIRTDYMPAGDGKTRRTVTLGNWQGLITTTLPQANYDRAALIFGTAWTRIIQGALDLELYPSTSSSTPIATARVNGADDGNTSTMGATTIKAGVAPTISMYFRATRSETAQDAIFEISRDAWTSLTVVAFPADMGVAA